MAARSSQPVIAPDLLAGPDGQFHPVAPRYAMGSLAAVPLLATGDSIAHGALMVASGDRRDIPTHLVAFLQAAAATLSGTLANARLLENLHVLNEQLQERVTARTQELTAAHDHILRASRLTAMGELAAGVAHELNTPLGTITGYAQFAEERLRKLGAEGEDAARSVQIVRQEADRCAGIVRNLLQFTRVSPGQTETIDTASLVQHVLDLVRHQLEVHHVKITFESTGALLVAAHADEMVQVFTNILINEQQAMPEGGELTVTVAPGESPGKVTISFADTGTGIPEACLSRIFDPFFTTKPVGQGTGLGLAVSYNMCRSTGGQSG